MKLLISIYRDSLTDDLRGSPGRANGYNLQQILYNNNKIFGNLHKFQNFRNVFGSAPVSSEFVTFITFWKGIEAVLSGKHSCVSFAMPEVLHKCCFVDDEYVISLRFFRDEILKTESSFSKTELLESIRKAQKNSNLYDFWSKVFENSVKMFDSEVVSVADISTMLFGFLVKKYSNDAYLVSETEPSTAFSTDYEHISSGNTSDTNNVSETLTNTPISDEANHLSDSVIFTPKHFESTWSNFDTSNNTNYSLNNSINVNSVMDNSKNNNVNKDNVENVRDVKDVKELYESDDSWDYEYKYRKLLSDLEGCLPRFYTYYSEAKCELASSKEEVRRLLELNEELNEKLTKEKNRFIEKNTLLNSEMESITQQNEHLNDFIVSKDKEIEDLKQQLEEVSAKFDSSEYGKAIRELQVYIAKSEGLSKSNEALKDKIFNLESALNQLQTNSTHTNTNTTSNTSTSVKTVDMMDEVDKDIQPRVLEDEISQLTNELTMLTNQVSQLTNELTQTKIEITQLKELNSTLEGDNLRLKEYNSKLESEMQHETSTLRNHNLSLTNTNNELVNSNIELKNSNDELINSNKELKNSNNELRITNDELKRENQLLEVEFDKIKCENVSLTSELNELNEKMKLLAMKNKDQEDFSGEYNKARQDIIELEKRLEELSRKNEYLMELYEQVSAENLKLVSKLEILNNPSPTDAKNKLVDLVKNYQKFDDLQSPLSYESESTDCDHSPNCSTISGEGSTNTLTNFHSNTLNYDSANNPFNSDPTNNTQTNLEPTLQDYEKNDVKENVKNERIKISQELASIRQMNTMNALKRRLVNPNSEKRTENLHAHGSNKLVHRRTNGFKRTVSMSENSVGRSFKDNQSLINYDKLSLGKSGDSLNTYDELGIEEQQEPNIIKNTFSFIYKKLNFSQ